MSTPSREPFDLFDFIQAFVLSAQAGTVTPAEVEELEHVLRESEDAQNLYIELVEMSVHLPRALAGIGRRQCGLTYNAPLGDDELAPYRATNNSPQSPLFSPLDIPTHGAGGHHFSGWWIAHFALTLMIGIGLIGVVCYPPRTSPMASSPQASGEVVGQITGMVGCRWAEPSTAAADGDIVTLGRRYALVSGLMEISYDTGARVILEGPVTYEVESKNGGFLRLGKLTGKVEANTAKGFAVRTPMATVVDLGTEFGVEVDKRGDATSHVFRGTVCVQVVAGGRADAVSKVLRENESARIERTPGEQGNGIRLLTLAPSAQPVSFVREIPKRTPKLLDLVDVVAGGDGFSGRRCRGIDPTSGQPKDTPMQEPKDVVKDFQSLHLVGDGEYHRVEAMPLVDGVFIPNGDAGPVQVDSAGHTFAEFRATSGKTAQHIWAGGTMPVFTSTMPPEVAALLVPLPPSKVFVRTELGGIDYASAGHGLIFLHANSGITFDLEAIRRSNPDCRLIRFRATAGNAEPATEKGVASSHLADLWVLVDGQLRFQRREVNGCSGAFPIEFPIADKDRFLTLVVTDSGNDIGGDWGLFGDPVLELLPIASAGQR